MSVCMYVCACVCVCVCVCGRLSVHVTLSHWGFGGLCVVDMYPNEFVERMVVCDQDVQAILAARVSNKVGVLAIDKITVHGCCDSAICG